MRARHRFVRPLPPFSPLVPMDSGSGLCHCPPRHCLSRLLWCIRKTYRLTCMKAWLMFPLGANKVQSLRRGLDRDWNTRWVSRFLQSPRCQKHSPGHIVLMLSASVASVSSCPANAIFRLGLITPTPTAPGQRSSRSCLTWDWVCRLFPLLRPRPAELR